MIDNKTDGDEKASDVASADKTGAADSEHAPQRGKLGIRKSSGASPGQDRPGGSTERTRQSLRSRFNGGLKPAQRVARIGSSVSPDAGPPSRPGRGEGRGVSKPQPPVVRRSEPIRAGEQAPQAEGVRLSKIMAERGLCSRREADQIIERGWVSVDGRRVSQLGIRIAPDAVVELAPEATARQAAQVTILLHKPVGYVSGQPEPEHVPAVTLIDAQSQFDRDVSQRFHPDHLRGLAPAGRLDIDSTGLLILTQNGRIARQLIGDDSKVEKEYLVRVEGRLDDQGLALLNHGLELDGRKLRPAKVEWVNEDQLRFVLREGRKRQIRRMCELVGLNVVGLKRVRIGRVRLGDLPLGQWRFLREDEQF